MGKSLYERIGGEAAVGAAVDLFYSKVLADQKISHFFDDVDMDNQRGMQKAFLTMAFGGPHNYTGRSLRGAHERHVERGLNQSHFDAVAGHLQATLDELGVSQDLAREVMTIVAGTQADVLNL